MTKRNLLNLILLVFIAVLIVFVIYEPGKDKAVTPPLLTDLKVGDIQNIKISRYQLSSEQQDISFSKTESGWVMSKPYPLTANTFRIDSILKLLSTVSLSQNNLEKLDPATFGLTRPRATITFNNTAIIFGHNKSLKHHRYVKIGSTLHMIKDTFYYQLTAKTESYIDHKLLPEKSNIQKIILPGLKLEQEDGKWKVTPKADSFSADSINQLISEWQLSQAYDLNKVKPQPNIKPGIIVHLKNNKVIRFKVKTNEEYFSLLNIDSGLRYILSADRKNKLLNLSGIEQND